MTDAASSTGNGLQRLIALLLMMALVPSLVATASWAADPQPYKLVMATTGEADLDAALTGSSLLESLREKAPVGPFALVLRAKDDIDRLQTVLQSFGYYSGHVTITILDRPIDDPELPSVLDQLPPSETVEVKVAIDKGPQFHLRRITIDGQIEPNAVAQLGLHSGQPARAAEVLAARDRLLAALQEDGHALARVDLPDATADLALHVLDVTFKVAQGPRLTIGPITITGLQDVSENFVRRRLLIHTGQLYQPSKIEAARLDLASLGIFSGVAVRAADQPDRDGRLPLTLDVAERPRHAVGATAAFSTDLGGSLSLTWSHRNLFGNAEQLNLSAAATGLGGSATHGIGYNFSAQLVKPDFLRRDQSLEFDLGALKQSLDAYDQTAETAGTALHRKLSERWTVSLGISGEQESIRQEGASHDYTLVGLPISAKYDSTGLIDPLADPTRGIRAALLTTPWQSFGRRSATFAVLQISGSTYFDLGEPGRSVLALRGLVGSTQGATALDLPPDQRFYGGGSATVRGFKYQSVGPLFADNKPIGGAAIDAATIEFRQRLFGNYGAALFVDAGQVSADNAVFSGTLSVGTGIGLRYYTPIGAVRADIAVPVNRPRGGDSFELYIGLGQAF
jgi:translocation and assembly module TamA